MNFKNRFVKDFVSIALSNSLSTFFSFFRTLLLIRFVGSEVYGRFQYIFALLVIADFICTNLDLVIKRYISERAEIANEILSINILLKIFSFSVSALALFAYFYMSGDLGDDSKWKWIAILIGARIFIGLFKNTFGGALQAVRQYHLINYVENITNLVLLVGLVVLAFGLNQKGTDLIVSLNILWMFLMIVGFLVIARAFKRRFGEFQFRLSKNAVKVGLLDFKSYFLPLMGTSVSGYLKLYLPAVLLGQNALFHEVAYYEVTKKIFGVVYKQIPAILLTLVPSIKEARKSANFLQGWSRGMLIYFSLNFLFGLFIFFFGPLIFHLYKIAWSQEISQIVLVFSIGLLAGGWLQAHQLLVFTENSTSVVLLSSILRQLVFAVFLAWVYPNFSPLILAIGSNGMHIPTILLYLYRDCTKSSDLRNLQGKYFLSFCVMSALIFMVHHFFQPFSVGRGLF
jgi:O-antigen/teichoic acid export membrane protein